MITLPNQVGEHPMFFALLEVCDLSGGQLGPPQSASEKNGNHRVIARAAKGGTVERLEECPALFHCQPIANPDSGYLAPFTRRMPALDLGVRSSSLAMQASSFTFSPIAVEPLFG